MNTNPLCSYDYRLLTYFLDQHPKVAYDLGANVGEYIEKFLDAGAEVHAFEPIKELSDALRQKYLFNRKVTINPFGIDNGSKTIPGVNAHLCWCLAQVGTTSQPLALEFKDKPAFDLHVTSIDTYLFYHPTNPIPEFIKVDIDGYEYRMLQGCMSLFKTNRPPMMFEYSFLPEVIGDNPEDMVKLIYQYGYKAVAMDGSYVCRDWTQMMDLYPAATSFDIMLLQDRHLVELGL